MAYVKRPNGFRAVRMRGKTEVVYCVEHECGELDVYAADGSKQGMIAKIFHANYTKEYSPMPDSVRAMFQGKPSFAEWWDGRQK